MKRLVDANVWFAALVEDHVHHRSAWEWWRQAADGEALWCRITQMAVLRLLTSHVAMDGSPLSLKDAWDAWQQVGRDPRASFFDGEPLGFVDGWRANIEGRATTPNLWTDAYLAALAELSGFGIVTFDKGFRHFGLTDLFLLKG